MKARLKSNINEITNIHKQLEEVQYKDELLLKVNYSIINNKAERTVIRIYGTNSTLKHVFHNVILSVSSFLYFVTTKNMNLLIIVQLLLYLMN